jgi:hypothetical protein
LKAGRVLNRWIGVTVIGVLMTVAVGTGCGGEEESTASSSVTKAIFVRQANAVCQKVRTERSAEINGFDKKLAETDERSGSKANLENKLKYILLPSMQSQLESLEVLEVPEAIEEEWMNLLESYATGIEKLEAEKLSGVFDAPELEKFGERVGALGLGRCAA